MSGLDWIPRLIRLGCLFVVLCGLAGFLIGGWIGESAARAYEAEDPNNYACGLFVLSYMVAGTLGGVFTGAILGAILELLLPQGKAH
jgi:hypothetical protein